MDGARRMALVGALALCLGMVACGIRDGIGLPGADGTLEPSGVAAEVFEIGVAG